MSIAWHRQPAIETAVRPYLERKFSERLMWKGYIGFTNVSSKSITEAAQLKYINSMHKEKPLSLGAGLNYFELNPCESQQS